MGSKKVSHWMWYILPQLRGLGQSALAWYYGIEDLEEPLYYAEFDFYGNKLVEMKKVRHQSISGKTWLDHLFWSRKMREVKHLEHCVMLLERGGITEEETVDTQAMWLD